MLQVEHSAILSALIKLSNHLSLRSLFGLFLNGRLRQVLLYFMCEWSVRCKNKCKLKLNLVAAELPLIFVSPFNRFKIYILFVWFDPENDYSNNNQKCIPLWIADGMLASICVIREVSVCLPQKGCPCSFGVNLYTYLQCMNVCLPITFEIV